MRSISLDQFANGWRGLRFAAGQRRDFFSFDRGQPFQQPLGHDLCLPVLVSRHDARF